jgi:hypothetical protein
MEPIKYVYSSYGNRELPEDQQGYALVTLISASARSQITNHLVSQSVRSGKKDVEVDFAKKSLQLNKQHCPKVFNVTDPLTGEKYNELIIDQVYEYGQFAELYEELSNAVGDINQLKDGIKKK